jgi:hypothetical protein
MTAEVEPAQALRRAADRLTPEELAGQLDALALDVIRRGVQQAGADEGTLWLAEPEGEHLVPVFNTGPHAPRIVGQFRQPLNAGLICMVFATEQPFLENDVQANARQSKLLDLSLGVRTSALIAAPLRYFRACRGVLSCVQLSGQPPLPAAPKAGGGAADRAAMERTSALLTRLIEWQIAAKALNLE